ncbi:MAG: raiA [Microbacteriaceae bacterium]|jgi:ribosomal subunit interface protein|nr:raiA [Microbacteriaceae bacterium]
MEISINGLGLGITDRFRSYATEKAEKISHLADKALAFEVKASRHNEKSDKAGSGGDDRVELTLIGPGPLVRAEATGSDKYVAFDLALDKLVERLRRAKDRQKVHRGQHRPTSLREAANSGGFGDLRAASIDVIERVATGEIPIVADAAEEEQDWSPVVIRKKVFDAMPMTVDDALYFMELVGHDFYLFIDAETDRPSVVYRRKGWDYGVIGLDNQAELAEAKRR